MTKFRNLYTVAERQTHNRDKTFGRPIFNQMI
jgi:hypothetical protein